MISLTAEQRVKLIEKARSMRREFTVAEDGVRRNIVYGVNGRFHSGLVKVEFPPISGTEVDKLADELARLTQSEIIYRYGEYAVYYKENPRMSVDDLFK